MIYVISDLHLFHNKVIEYCNRPFSNVAVMHDVIIGNWNSVVNDDDIVYNLGDVTFAGFRDTKLIMDQLNGMKYLIRGNHDRGHTNTWFKNVGFLDVYDELQLEINLVNVLLTHKPTSRVNFINVHGHLHNSITTLDSSTFKCVSVECVNYTPVNIELLLM
jgi:calcineurin-like phosphoesterase family protein